MKLICSLVILFSLLFLTCHAEEEMKLLRKVKQHFKSQPMMEGAGVLIHRSIGTGKLRNFDPFLMLDEFKNDNPEDYIEGFPDHPHRGFETVTYMLKGSFEHRDHMGNVGLLKDGSVQWMTAGAGIIHSEMPKQTEGMVHGFQMWINLPKKDKMCKPRYQDIQPEDIPIVKKDTYTVKVVAGEYDKTVGPVNGIVTNPIFFDVRLNPNTEFEHVIPVGHTCFAYLFDGKANFGDLNESLSSGNIVVFDSEGDTVKVKTEDSNASFILVAAKPIGEPIFQRGPFVLASQEDLVQAFVDMQTGMFLKRAN